MPGFSFQTPSLCPHMCPRRRPELVVFHHRYHWHFHPHYRLRLRPPSCTTLIPCRSGWVLRPEMVVDQTHNGRGVRWILSASEAQTRHQRCRALRSPLGNYPSIEIRDCIFYMVTNVNNAVHRFANAYLICANLASKGSRVSCPSCRMRFCIPNNTLRGLANRRYVRKKC